MSTRLLFIHALSPLHAGTGHSIGAVDLPIARDKATSHPILPGSSIKGCLRDAADGQPWVGKVFGPETKNASDHAGAAVFSDANLLLLPVRSLYGTFAWVTCPLALDRYRRDAKEAGAKNVPASSLVFSAPPKGSPPTIALPAGSTLKEQNKTRVYFEELDFERSQPHEGVAGEWAKHLSGMVFAGDDDAKASFVKRFCIVPDDVFTHLGEHATDVVTRVSIDRNTKTVKDGQLWTEESLPTESILVSLVFARPPKQTGIAPEDVFRHLNSVTQRPVQFGGKATVGRGRCRVLLAGGLGG